MDKTVIWEGECELVDGKWTKKSISRIGKYTFHISETFGNDPERAKEGEELLIKDLAKYYIKRFHKEFSSRGMHIDSGLGSSSRTLNSGGDHCEDNH